GVSRRNLQDRRIADLQFLFDVDEGIRNRIASGEVAAEVNATEQQIGAGIWQTNRTGRIADTKIDRLSLIVVQVLRTVVESGTRTGLRGEAARTAWNDFSHNV